MTPTISDHLPQFMIVPNAYCNPPSNKVNIFERDLSKFDEGNFIFDYFSVDWNVALKLEGQNVDYSTESLIKLTHYYAIMPLLKKSTSTN